MIPVTNHLFTYDAGDAISIYGTGATVEVGSNAIMFGINF